MFDREYSKLLEVRSRPLDRDAAMANVVKTLWDAFGEPDPANPTRGGISWVGFYLKVESSDEMVLVCREPKPACSPVGLHGMCGRGWRDRTSFTVRDVAVLGANYVACDPRDKSELVVPMLDARGQCTGVLDVDSYQVGAFARRDAEAMWELMVRAGLCDANSKPKVVEL